jgi:hypothetical protein
MSTTDTVGERTFVTRTQLVSGSRWEILHLQPVRSTGGSGSDANTCSAEVQTARNGSVHSPGNRAYPGVVALM